MATVKNNDLVDGLSGKFGRFLVFRNVHGKTFVSHPARKPNKKKETEAQRNTRDTFREATQWARRTLLVPEKKIYYQQRAKALKLPNAYTAAITDYMRKPKVEKKQQGNTLHYKIGKNGFALKHVTATVDETTAAGTAKVSVYQHKDNWIIQYRPDVNTTNPLLTLTITDYFGRSNVITTCG